MNSKKVSVIIPVYNTEKYLDKCISSVINQTYKNIEIIIVDDGSTDHSSALCKKWESIDERVLVLRKVNGGLSSARNYGLEKSSGNYIFFVDSDDWIASNTIELMVCKAEALNCDIVISNYYDYYSETQIVPVIRTKEQLVLEPVEKCLLNILPTNAWGKLIRRDIFYDDTNLILKFPENRRYEDTVISFKQILKAQIVYTLSDALYYYRQNMESIVYNPKATDITDIIKNVTEIRNLLKNKVSEELLEAYLCSTLVFAYQLYYRTSCNNAELRKRLISSIKYSASKVRVRTACKNIKRKKILIAKLPFFDIIIQLNEKAKRKF